MHVAFLDFWRYIEGSRSMTEDNSEAVACPPSVSLLWAIMLVQLHARQWT